MNNHPDQLPHRPAPGEDICTEAEITALVHGFYAKVRRDAVLGPIFETKVDDWDRHLAKLVDFWSAILRGTGRFSGDPMAKHAALPGLSSEFFRRWLQVFRDNAAAQPNKELNEQACAAAKRIASNLWKAYAKRHFCEAGVNE